MERRSPYQGLAPFGADDVAFFGGRARDIRLIVASLFASRLTLLYGPGGVGKSSVLHAGVLPRLTERSGVLVVSVRDWSADPVRSIAVAVARATGGGLPDDPADLGALLEQCFTGRWRRIMLVLDQFEHALSARDDDEALVAGLSAALLRPGLPISALIAIRADSLAELDRFEGRLPGVFDTPLRLEHLDRDAGAEAIRGPLAAWEHATGEDVELEDALVEAVLDAVPAGQEDGIETSQLQLVMTRVWDAERAAGSARLRLETLRALGGADGIVRDHVRDALDRLAGTERELAAVVLDRLVTPSGARIAHLAGDLAGYAGSDTASLLPVLERLSAARVLRPVAGEGTEARFEVYHELLADAVLAWLTDEAADRREAVARAGTRRRVFSLIAVAAIAIVVAVVLAGALIAEKRSSDTATSRALGATARRLLEGGGDPQAALALALRAAKTRPTREARLALRAALGASHERTVRAGPAALLSIEFNRDASRLLTLGADRRVRLWERSAARPPRTLTTADASVARFCPDATRIAVAGDGAALLVEGRRRRLVDAQVDDLACSADGRFVAVRTPDRVRLFDARTGTLARSLSTPWNGTRGRVALSADGSRVVANVADGAVVIDLRERRLSRRLASGAGTEPVTSVAISAGGGAVVTGGAAGTVRRWDVASGSSAKLAKLGEIVDTVGYGAGTALVLAVAGDRTAHVWDAATSVELATLRGHQGDIDDAAFAPDGRTVATASDDHTWRLWQVPGSTVLPSGEGLTYGAFTRDGRHVVTATMRGTIEVFDEPGGGRTARFTVAGVPDAAGATRVAATADAGRIVVLDGSERVRLFDPARPSVPPTELADASDHVVAVDYSGDGRVIALAGKDGAIRVVDPSGRQISRYQGRAPDPLLAVAFSPDARRVAAVSLSNEIVVVDARSGRPIQRIRAASADLATIAFSPDGTRLIAGGGDGASIWDLAGGGPPLRLGDQEGAVKSASFDADGDLAATASDDGEILIWDASSRDLLTTLAGRTASFGTDRFILATSAGPTRLYACDVCGSLQTLEARAAGRIDRPLTDAQVKMFTGG